MLLPEAVAQAPTCLPDALARWHQGNSFCRSARRGEPGPATETAAGALDSIGLCRISTFARLHHALYLGRHQPTLSLRSHTHKQALLAGRKLRISYCRRPAVTRKHQSAQPSSAACSAEF